MGLDMYLEKRTYVKQWDHQSTEERHNVQVTKGGKPVAHIKPERVSGVVEEIMCWRKANHIHAWFVENVQGGEDDCGHYYVDEEKLKSLRDLCKIVLDSTKTIDGEINNGYTVNAAGEKEYFKEPGKVVEDDTVAKSLLPTQSGFFFGNTDYDEYYIEDVRRTYEALNEILNDPEEMHGDFYYHSSW